MNRVGERPSRQRAGLGVVSLCLVQFLDVMGVTVVVAALPDMLLDLGASTSTGSLVATGYAMFFGGLLMLGARLGDRFGHRRTILVSLAVFAGGSLLAATSPSVVLLATARCVQGAAAAVSVPSALRLITTITEAGRQRRRSLALWSATGAAAGVSGFVVGGAVTAVVSWRAVFWGYLPLTVALGLAIGRAVPSDRDRDASTSLNLAGSGLFIAGVATFVVGTTLVNEAGRGWTGELFLLASGVLAASFRWADRRAAAPLLPRAVLRLPTLRQGTVASALNTLTTSSVITLVTLYLQDARGRSPLAAAAMLVPFSVAVTVGSALAAPALHRVRPLHVVAAGLALIGASDALLCWAAPTPWALAASVAVAGAGVGLSSVAATTLGTDVAPVWRGTASAVINTAAQLGTALGIAVLVLVAAATTGLPRPGGPVPAVAWALAAGVALLAAAAFGLRATRGRLRRDAGQRVERIGQQPGEGEFGGPDEGRVVAEGGHP